MYLETERLILRDYNEDDFDEYYRLKTDDKTMYYLQDILLHKSSFTLYTYLKDNKKALV